MVVVDAVVIFLWRARIFEADVFVVVADAVLQHFVTTRDCSC